MRDDGLDELGSDSFGFNAGVEEVFEDVVDSTSVAGYVRFKELGEGSSLRQTESLFKEGGGDSLVGKSGDLVKNTERIAEGTPATANDNIKSAVFDRNLLGIGDFAEVLLHGFRVSEAKSVDLGTRGDGDRDFVSVGGSHNEDNVFGRLLEGF